MILAACNLPNGNVATPDSGTVATTVAATFRALTKLPTQTSLSTPTLLPPTQTPLFTLTVPSPTLALPPKLTPTVIITALPSNTPIPSPGTIAGNISGYPYGSLPGLAIVAYGQNPPYNYSWIITVPGTTNFSMSTDYTLPGPYQVVAYDASGNSGGCPGLATIISNQTVTCTINDWASAYRSKPSGVPNP